MSESTKRPINQFKWDKWQREVLDHMGNISIRSGRQVGKSEVISEKAVRLAMGYLELSP